MLILLPPSEGKTRPETGPLLELSALSRQELSPARQQVLTALVETSARPDASELLKLSKGLISEVVANRGLAKAPTAPALEVYSGVLYQALSPSSWSDQVKDRADKQLVIFSALFGALNPWDQIPAYRLSGGVKLPGIGSPAIFWRAQLTPVLGEHDLVIDARSSTYAQMWKPGNIAKVRVFTERNGERKVVSHLAKQARGLVAQALLSTDSPQSLGEAVEFLNDWFALRRQTGQSSGHTWVERCGSGIDVISTES